MFKNFTQEHEEAVRDYLADRSRGDPEKTAAAAGALIDCRGQIVDALKSVEEPQLRRQIRLLYEGLTIASEFLCRQVEPGDRRS